MLLSGSTNRGCMRVSNFDILRSYQPKLFDDGRSAENYAYSYPQSAITKLRCFAELFVAYIYEEFGNDSQNRVDQSTH